MCSYHPMGLLHAQILKNMSFKLNFKKTNVSFHGNFKMETFRK